MATLVIQTSTEAHSLGEKSDGETEESKRPLMALFDLTMLREARHPTPPAEAQVIVAWKWL
jgi:hypothetical protein